MNFMKTLTSYIEKTNKAFTKANKARKRVMIAKDIIITLDAKEFKASKGAYLYAAPEAQNIIGQSKNNEEMRNIIPSLGQCQVCAKGAIFACTIMRRDNLTKDQYYSMRWHEGCDGKISLSEALGGLFTNEQLLLIENSFEGWDNGITYFNKYGFDSDTRLRAIMNNIIKNKGTFIPEKD